MSNYDSIILGSSANALATAAYLARAGEKVILLEPGERLGGAFSTHEFSKGFFADTSLLSGRLDAALVNDLNLEKHGLEVLKRESITSLLPGGKSFTLPEDRKAAAAVIRNFSPSDADKYEKFMQLLDLGRDLLRSAYSMPAIGSDRDSADAERCFGTLLGKLRGFGRREMTEVMRLFVMSVRDFLNEWFENAELKGLLASPATRGLMQGPFGGATTFTLLHHLAIDDAYFRSNAKGGIAAINQALAAAAKAHGAELRTSAKIKRVLLSDGAAQGVELDGEIINSKKVISDFDAGYTFKHLVSPPDLEPEFNRALQQVRCNGSVARINLALSELPEFTGLAEDALRGTLVLSPNIAYLEKAYDAAKYGGISSAPYLELCIPSLADPSLAVVGKHVLSIWMQHVPFSSKELDAEKVLELALSALSEFSPKLKSLVTASQVLTPRDFEEKFHLSEGHLYGSDMTMTQAFYLRPIPGYARYKTPIENLFLCGSATHPGGGLSGLASKNLVKELGLKEPAMTPA